MNIRYFKFSPTGNDTLLIDSPVPRDRQGALAARLLERLGGEQVGYIEVPADPGARARLQMMGGEFCGNATMALGALIARMDAPQGGVIDLLIEVSGCAAPVPCRIRADGDGWLGTVRMPLPTAVTRCVVETDAGPLDAPLVVMPGISHLILPVGAAPSPDELRRRLSAWNRQIGADALGALLWDESSSTIDPLVYVPSASTLVRERGCGSGSAAVGCWLALRAGHSLNTAVRQSGGTIEVEARIKDNALESLSITGHVAPLEEGSLAIDV